MKLSYFLAVIGLVACSSKKVDKSNEAGPDLQDREENLGRARLEPYDFSGDGFPRVQKHFETSSNKVDKVEYDFNGDGMVDFIQKFDAQGKQVVSEEADLNGDGKIDVTYFFESNVKGEAQLIRQEFSSRLDAKTKVWKFYEAGKLVRREISRRDSGRPDLFEYYMDGRLVKTDFDNNQDGIPDLQPKLPDRILKK